ncbi:MAG: hypothetical protein ACQEQI_01475 [Bacillota bacterium]
MGLLKEFDGDKLIDLLVIFLVLLILSNNCNQGRFGGLFATEV